jgi:hypothetical protein
MIDRLSIIVGRRHIGVMNTKVNVYQLEDFELLIKWRRGHGGGSEVRHVSIIDENRVRNTDDAWNQRLDSVGIV